MSLMTWRRSRSAAAADRKRAEAVALDGAENLALRGVDRCDFHGEMADLLE